MKIIFRTFLLTEFRSTLLPHIEIPRLPTANTMAVNPPSGAVDVQAELQQYLKDKNLNAIFVAVVESLLISKPENPIEFMAKHLLVS